MKTEIDKFGMALRKAIEDSNYSYAEVAVMIGLKSKREIYNYISGLKWPSNVRMLKLIQIFKLDINSILN
ncbi:MAG: helix-turn-helix domain-containing protein [Anaeroplasma sp.]